MCSVLSNRNTLELLCSPQDITGSFECSLLEIFYIGAAKMLTLSYYSLDQLLLDGLGLPDIIDPGLASLT